MVKAQKTYTIFDIANWFLLREIMSHHKLQKLCYYAQAWSLALNNRRLIDADFEAWARGAICVPLWNYCISKNYGYAPIKPVEFRKRAAKISDNRSVQLLRSVWKTYGRFNEFELERLIQSEKPWQIARKGHEPFEPCNVKINEDDMKEFYRLLKSQSNITAKAVQD